LREFLRRKKKILFFLEIENKEDSININRISRREQANQ